MGGECPTFNATGHHQADVTPCAGIQGRLLVCSYDFFPLSHYNAVIQLTLSIGVPILVVTGMEITGTIQELYSVYEEAHEMCTNGPLYIY